MPSTPRMIEIERKVSSPGEALTQAEVTEWHREHVEFGMFDGQFIWPQCGQLVFVGNIAHERVQWLPPDYSAAHRYLDSMAYKAPK